MGKKLFCALAIAGALVGVATAAEIGVSIDPSKTFQTIDNFAASDAWSGNFVGQYFSDFEKGKIAKWLFSQKIGEDGNPEGIGLSMWRVNLGGGTLEQDGADIMPFQRRAESFLTKDGKHYDWGKCAGQQWFMRKAKEYGCDKFLLFSNTPPVQWTFNGKGYCDKNWGKSNLKPAHYADFANYLADVAKYFESRGFSIKYISPMNEPQGPWHKSAQEGSSWRTDEMKRVYVELDRALSERNLDTVMNSDHGYYYTLWRSSDFMKKFFKGDANTPSFMVKKFFDKASADYIGNLKHISNIVGAHAYESDKTFKMSREARERAREECEKYGVVLQQTEWCFFPCYNPKNHAGFTPDWVNDTGTDIQASMLLARVVYADFVYAGATAWGYWKGMEINGDRALTGVYPSKGDITKGGVSRPNKILWALGNYSLFIRPQFKRIELAGADDLEKVAGTAFISPDGNRIVAVLVNSSPDETDAKISLPDNVSARIKKFAAYRTDANSNLANVRARDASKFVLSPRSITTIVFDLK